MLSKGSLRSSVKQTSPLMLMPTLDPIALINAYADAESAMSAFAERSSKEA